VAKVVLGKGGERLQDKCRNIGYIEAGQAKLTEGNKCFWPFYCNHTN